MPTFEQFRLPDAGEGLTEAEIVAWHVVVGDTVTVNQTIVEIETAKSIVELPSPFDGVVTELLVASGVTVEVGTPIIVFDVDPTGAAPTGAAPAGAGPTDAAPAASGGAPPAVPAATEPVASAVAVPAAPADEASGAVLVGYGVAGQPTARRPRRVPTLVAPSAAIASAGAVRLNRSAQVLAKPPVRKLARDLGVDLDSVSPTGPGGIVTREDVLAMSAQGSARALATYAGDDQPWLASGKVSAGGRQTRVPVKSVRKRTAEAMVASAFTAPHVTVFHTIDVTKMMKLVTRLRADKEFADVRVTPLLITAKALLLAVHRHPEINASWDESAQEIVYKHYINLGIAASTPRGLVVPNIKDAHRLGLKELAQEIATLTATARAGRTSPADMSDGTITITNVGVFGIDTGTPILNPGEAAILAFGAIREQPWVHKGKIKKRLVTQLALSFDHRLVDGGLGSRLLADVAAVLEDPAQALVWG
ncbi:dihydrolipoamide acetyltransferase family protein [Pengzhenrongella sicca]|uniref:Dihydrolipoamide acetyltransferase component of pyruvate dehydrogenase complex n=1 Tax=Pengzhenrongella sicca TaxID=2819238 RepID=A0A8A4ZDE3_9MICO|nr:dihydrolipoamide acetyltransferase family protein [Pengzhenrongella sicca]QTE29441.1 2-oxo acid dehydrogenase subunit E2 [Pengzhenrongella sicca]